MTVTEDLNAEETMLVETVRAFIDRDVKIGRASCRERVSTIV